MLSSFSVLVAGARFCCLVIPLFYAFPFPSSFCRLSFFSEDQLLSWLKDEGDQFMAVKPWLGAIKEPTEPYYKGSGKPPPVELEL